MCPRPGPARSLGSAQAVPACREPETGAAGRVDVRVESYEYGRNTPHTDTPASLRAGEGGGDRGESGAENRRGAPAPVEHRLELQNVKMFKKQKC